MSTADTSGNPHRGPCGWRVWQERPSPHQWIGQCNRTVCPGGIRTNSEAAAWDFFTDQHDCFATAERRAVEWADRVRSSLGLDAPA